jgi:hypothetical protein
VILIQFFVAWPIKHGTGNVFKEAALAESP